MTGGSLGLRSRAGGWCAEIARRDASWFLSAARCLWPYRHQTCQFFMVFPAACPMLFEASPSAYAGFWQMALSE